MYFGPWIAYFSHPGQNRPYIYVRHSGSSNTDIFIARIHELDKSFAVSLCYYEIIPIYGYLLPYWNVSYSGLARHYVAGRISGTSIHVYQCIHLHTVMSDIMADPSIIYWYHIDVNLTKFLRFLLFWVNSRSCLQLCQT